MTIKSTRPGSQDEQYGSHYPVGNAKTRATEQARDNMSAGDYASALASALTGTPKYDLY